MAQWNDVNNQGILYDSAFRQLIDCCLTCIPVTWFAPFNTLVKCLVSFVLQSVCIINHLWAIWQTIGNVLHEYNNITQVGERGRVHECVGTEKIPAYTIVVAAINTSLLSILHCHRYSTINIS